MTTYYLESNKDYHDKDLNPDDAVNETLLEDTAKYYEDCHQDYLFAWCNRDNLALHYGYWDEDKPYNHHQALLNTNRALYEKAGIKPSDHVLDAGCGLGGSSLWMAGEYKNKVTGITISHKQADYANAKAKSRNLEHLVNFEVADYCKTPYEDESFDVIWALESSCYALDKGAFLKEAHRLLRKGGRLALCDAFMLQREFDKTQWQTVMDFLNGWLVPNLSDRDEFTRLIKEAGFQESHAYDISEQVLPSSKYMYKIAKRLAPVQKISQWLGLRSKTQTANYKVGFAQYDFFHDKLAEYCIFTATK
ncbi:MAG: methyltransferase domain-containing protein [Methylococcales bacterium]|nr:methyltransferase domain-containing protein [Methylococcales bacterium]